MQICGQRACGVDVDMRTCELGTRVRQKKYRPVGSLAVFVTIARLGQIVRSDFNSPAGVERVRTTLHFAHIRSSIRGTAFPQPQHSARWLVRLSRRSWREGRFSSYPARILGSETVTIVGIWMVGFAALGLGIDMYVQLRLCYAVKYWFSEIMVMGRGERDPGPRVSLEDSLRDLGPCNWQSLHSESDFERRGYDGHWSQLNGGGDRYMLDGERNIHLNSAT